MRYAVFFVLLIQVCVGQTPPSGWSSRQHGTTLEMSPPDLPANRMFLYALYPPEARTQSTQSWLRDKAEKDISTLGKQVRPLQYNHTGPIQNVTGAIMNQGRAQVVAYMATEQAGQRHWARIITDADAKFFKPYLSEAIKHFTAVSKVSHSSAASKNKPEKRSRAKRPETPLTAPGKGLTPAQIQGIYMHLETGFGVGGFVTQNYEAYLFLRDGTVYEYPDVPPYDLDVPASRQTEPKRWGRWKKQGSKIVIQESDGKTSDWDHWHVAVAAKPGEKLSGSFKSISGGGNVAFGGSSVVVSMKRITFLPTGQFRLASTGGGSDANVSAYSNKDLAGTYQLDQHVITLKFNNGQVERRFFYFYPDSRDTFGMGGSVFVPAD